MLRIVNDLLAFAIFIPLMVGMLVFGTFMLIATGAFEVASRLVEKSLSIVE